MTNKNEAKKRSEAEIDDLIAAQADDDTAWEEPVKVHKTTSASVSLPSELAYRASFFARLHREANVEEWLRRIIQERVDLEEAAFAGMKRDLAAKQNSSSRD
jgi:hypothetical protein